MTRPGEERALDDLAQRYVERLRGGEAVTPEEYCHAHPDLATRIRELFPVLAMMEGLGPNARRTPAESDGLPGGGRLGPYQLVREVGQGGMGRVFEGRDASEATVAIKLVHPHLVGQPGYLARFLREFEAGQRVEHEAVVRTLDSGIVELLGAETPYLVLEYVEGQNLRDLIAELAPLSERLCRLIARRVATGLDALHQGGLVHRDVKPENVVITHDEQIKLMDLGVALVQDEQYRLSSTGDFVGSFLYASPEQIRGKTPDARSDLYGLGMLLFEAVTGVHPEAQDDGTPPRTRSPHAPAPSASDRRPSVSRFFDRVIATLLAPDVDQRFATAGELLAVLAAGESGPWWRTQAAAGLLSAQQHLARAHPRPTALIGREEELRALRQAWIDVRQGTGRAVVVVGDAGMGKSRLVGEWLDSLEVTGPAAPQVVFAENDPGAAGAAALIPALQKAVSSEAPPSASPRASVLVRDVRQRAGERPLIVVVEDLHFASPESQQLFDTLVRLTEYEQLMVVGTAQADRESGWTADQVSAQAARIELQPLSATSSHDLFRARLGSNAPHASEVVEIVRASDGNPLCLIAFAETLKDRGPLTGPPVPASVQQLVEGRLRNLDDTSRTLLEVAACCGNEFDPVVVCDAAEVPRLRGLRTLHELDRKRGLIVMRGARYRFRHHVVLQALSATLPAQLRTAYHGVLGVALESSLPSGGSAPEDVALQILRHHILGGHVRRAVPFAVTGLQYLYDNSEFVPLIRMARTLLDLGDDLPTLETAHTRIVLGLSLLNTGSTHEGLEQLELAYDIRDALRPPHSASEAASLLAHGLREVGNLDRAIEVQRVALAEVEAENNASAIMGLTARMAVTLTEAGQTDEARRLATRSLDLARELGEPVAVSEAARCLGDLELEAGHLDRARPLLTEAVETATAGSDPTRASALNSLAKIEYTDANYRAAAGMQERLVAMAHVWGHAGLEATSRINIMQSLLELGRFEDAAAHARTVRDVIAPLGNEAIRAYAELASGQLHEWQGDWGTAEARYTQACESALRGQIPGGVVRVRARQVHLRAWLGAFDEAEALTQRTMADLPGQLARAEVQLVRAQVSVLMARGDYAQARDQLEQLLARVAQSSYRGEQIRVYRQLGMATQASGDFSAAADHYRAGLELAGPEPSVESRLLRALIGSLPDGAAAVAALSLDEHADALPVHDRILARYWLAARLGDKAQLQVAAHDLDALLATVTPEERSRACTRVPLYRDVLAGTLPTWGP